MTLEELAAIGVVENDHQADQTDEQMCSGPTLRRVKGNVDVYLHLSPVGSPVGEEETATADDSDPHFDPPSARFRLQKPDVIPRSRLGLGGAS